jgi:type III secretory pathway component EscU
MMTTNFTPPQGKAMYTIRKERRKSTRRNKHTQKQNTHTHSGIQHSFSIAKVPIVVVITLTYVSQGFA